MRADASLNLPSHFVSLDAAMLSLPLSRKFSVQAARHFLLCLYSVQLYVCVCGEQTKSFLEK